MSLEETAARKRLAILAHSEAKLELARLHEQAVGLGDQLCRNAQTFGTDLALDPSFQLGCCSVLASDARELIGRIQIERERLSTFDMK